MKNRQRLLAQAALTAMWALPAQAVILHHDRVELALRPGKVAEGAAWSEGLALKADGLATGPEAAGTQWVRMQTVPVGLGWRPPSSARFELEVFGAVGEKAGVKARLRHSVGRVHWSPWEDMSPGKPKAKGAFARASLEVKAPAASRAPYDRLMAEWRKTDPDWQSDEQELCHWIARTHRDFFKAHRPLLGWVQVRVEATGLGAADRISAVRLEVGWGVGGLSSLPKSGKPKATERGWCFDLRRTSPGEAWSALLKAMAAGDAAEIKRFTTPEGLKSITVRHDGRARTPERLQLLAKAWSKFEVRWGTWSDTEAAAAMGPEVKEHGLKFAFTPAGWKLAEWRPGE